MNFVNSSITVKLLNLQGLEYPVLIPVAAGKNTEDSKPLDLPNTSCQHTFGADWIQGQSIMLEFSVCWLTCLSLICILLRQVVLVAVYMIMLGGLSRNTQAQFTLRAQTQ